MISYGICLCLSGSELPYDPAIPLLGIYNDRTFFFFYFPTVQQRDQVILTCIRYNYIFPPPFVLLQHEYLDKVLNAIQQDLLVNLF